MAKGKKGAKTRVGWQSPKNMMHNFMIIVFNQRMIQAYMEELMIKLATLLKIPCVMESGKSNFFYMKIEAHLV